MRTRWERVGLVVGAVALGLVGCGGSDGDRVAGTGGGGGEVDCGVLEEPFVAPRVVGPFSDAAPTEDPTVAEVEVAVAQFPVEHEVAGGLLVDLVRDLDALEAGDGSLEQALEISARYEQHSAEMEAAVFWAGEQCRGDRILWRCIEGGAQPFRSVGRAIGDGEEPPPVHATVEEAADVDGMTEVVRNDREAVYAELDEDGYAVRVRSVDFQGDLGWIDQGDVTCDDAEKLAMGSDDGGFEPIGEPTVSTTQVLEEVGP